MKSKIRHAGPTWLPGAKRFACISSLFFLLSLFVSGSAIAQQNRALSGRVVAENGQGLAGASVGVKNTAIGTRTDSAGNFTLQVPGAAVLVVSYVGYAEQEIPLNRDQNDVVISLRPSGAVLSEVVVIGYGTANRRDLTGSIVKIAGREVADRPNANPVASLQGKVAGLSVVNSGTPGQEPDIRIRGTVSIGAVKPLYVVDGIFNDNISYLNPNDIESIEVLKDPSSLAIFGVRGASGVIAITTKKARAGQAQVTLSSNTGFKTLVDKIDMVDAAQFKMLFQEEEENLGVPLNERFNFGPWTGNTDWVDAVTQTGMFSNNNIGITASTEKNRFYMSVGYTNEEGIVRHERLRKIMLAINDEFRVSKALRFGFTFNGVRQRLPFSNANGILFDARRVLPITPVTNADGVFTELAIQRAQISNPLMQLEEKWDKELRIENRTVGSVFGEVNFLRNFNFRTTFYADLSNLDERRYNPIINTWNPELDTVYVDQNNRLTSVNQGSSRWNKYQQDHILTYKKDFGAHGLTAIGGFTTYYNNYNAVFGNVSQRTTGDPIPDDPRFWYISNGIGDATTQRSSSGQWEKATVSYLFRALYNYEGRYLLNASFRRDGSSQISPLNRWQNFYSIGAAWDLGRERFMETQNIFNTMKLKASWGVLGVQNTFGFDYPYFPALLAGNTAVFGGNVVPAYSLAYEPQRNLKWERVDAKEAGVEFTTLNRRLNVEANYYIKTTEDIMNMINLGNNRRRLDNVGSIRNNGLELSAAWTQTLSRNSTFNISGNFTTFNNKVLSLGDKFYASEERPNQTEPGFPISYFYGYIVDGIYQSNAEIAKSPKVQGYTITPGDLKYRDVNGDGFINTADRTMIGNPTPDFAYGGSVSLTYRGFDVGMDVNGVYGNEVYRVWGSSELPYTKFNYPAFKLNRWNGPGTSNWDPILGDNHPINRLPSTYGIEDGSYFRIRNLQLGYNFSSDLLRRVHLQNLRLFVNAQNLKTFKNNSGYTPEFGGDALSFGIDNGNGPIPRVITGGVNVTF